MGIRDSVTRLLSIEPMHERSVLFESHAIPLEEQVLALRRKRLRTHRTWRVPSITEALGVPAVYGAVNMIGNVTGSMSMKAFRREVELSPDQRPSIIVRPDPNTIPREFYRGTAYNMASRGEAWWWISKRDTDGSALSLFNVAPIEVLVTENDDDPRYPIIEWRGRRMRNEDMRQLVWSREPGDLRGSGPLQICGAAVSVAVESQEWAANFYTTGYPDLWIKAAGPLGGGDDGEDPDGLSEAQRLKSEWTSRTPNTPAVTGDDIEDIKQFDVNQQGAQMLQARVHQNVDVATMYNMDAALLNAATQGGGSLRYQNLHTEFEKFLRMCLQPNVLETIEQTMSDLLTRSIVSRFNTDALTLADIKTRYDVYGIGIDKGIIDAEEARRFEGLEPGDVENAAVPFAPPRALPTAAALQVRSAPTDLRCPKCSKLKAANFAGSGDFKCDRCGHAWVVAA